MYFTKIRLNGLSTIDLPIVGATPSDRYILRNADGLGPPEVDVTITDTLHAGGFYQGRRPQSRELVFLIGLNPDFASNQTVSDLRTELYGMLTPGHTDSVLVQIMNESTVLMDTKGYVKRLEAVPFSSDPQVQLTIACVENYFKAPTELYVDPGNVYLPEINNIGTAPAGFRMEIIFLQPTWSWYIFDRLAPTTNKMQVVYDFIKDDILTIDTRPGSRGIWVTRSTVKTNALMGLSSDSKWFMLHGGNNLFTTLFVQFRWGQVSYLPQYWGI